MKWGMGPLVGWTLTAAPPAQREVSLRSYLLQHVNLTLRGDLQADRRLLRHPVGGRPLGVVMAQALLEHTEDALRDDRGPPTWRQRADAEGFRLGYEDVLDRVDELADERGAVAVFPAIAELTYRWLLSDGSIVVAERYPCAPDLWRIVQEPVAPIDVAHRDLKPENVLADRDLKPDNITHNGPAMPPTTPSHAASSVLAAPSNGTTTVPIPEDLPEDPPSSSHAAGALPAAPSPGSFPPAGVEDALSSAPAGSEPVLVGELVPEVVARLREAQRVAAAAALASGPGVLLVPELQLRGGQRVPTAPGIVCCWCARVIGTYLAVCDQDDQGAYRWAHTSCAFDELERTSGAYGTLADMRRKLGEAGVDLTGDETFNELRAAIYAMRKRDLGDVDWTKKDPKTAAKVRECALCPAGVQKGDLYRDAGEGRAAHELCLEAAGFLPKAAT